MSADKPKADDFTAPLIIGEWPKNDRETLRVRLGEYRGHPIIDIRYWFRTPEGELRPGRSGITMAAKHLHRLAAALAAAEALAEQRGLIAPDQDNREGTPAAS